MSDTCQYVSSGLVCQGEGHGPPSQMSSSSQAPHVFDPLERNVYQSLQHQAQPISVYNDGPFPLGHERDDVCYDIPGMVRKEPVSTGRTIDEVSYQQHYRLSSVPDYPTLHQESDLSAITASSGTVESSASYDIGDSETGMSSWSFNNPSVTKPGWDASIQGQRDYCALGSKDEHDDWFDPSDVFLPESIELESMQRISLPFIQSLTYAKTLVKVVGPNAAIK